MLEILTMFLQLIQNLLNINQVANTYYLEIDVYFIEYPLAVEIDEKKHADRDLIFEEKRQEALEKKTWL